jgi:indolepyruvate ferredoxin oxidoreductase
VRIDTQQADAVLACDLVVGASPEALQTVRHGRTRILANVHEIPVAESVRKPDAELRADELLAKLQFAAGADRVQTFDAQALAQAFLGDTVAANIVALGYAWQRGLVPVSLAALQRAIELNGVAVPMNLLAFSLGRLAAADPQALATFGQPQAAADALVDADLGALIDRAMKHLTAWQNAAWAERWLRTVRAAEAKERALGGGLTLPFTQAVGRSLLKLMSYKDEYEVARLYTDGSFQRALHEQFEGDLRLSLHLAPPLLSRARDGQPPRKLRLGSWMLPVLGLLARARHLRGTALDVFGRTAERRLERQLIDDFEARVSGLLATLDAARLPLATAIARVPLAMRGFGHVKLAQVAVARAREAELLHRWDPLRHPRPVTQAQPGSFKGIELVSR